MPPDRTSRPPGLFATLTPEQQAKVLAYDGLENHGDPAFAADQSDRPETARSDALCETLIGAPALRQKAGRVQQGWRRGNGKWVWFDVPQVSEDAPDVEE